ncbi:MAG: succinate dehydrogenase assembly factor 2 [Pseudomonadota bacterium]
MTDPGLRQKRLRLACRRGMLEVELALRPWFERHGAGLSPAELDDFERLLVLEDLDLWEVLCSRQPDPEGLVSGLVARLKRELFAKPDAD